MGCNVGDDSCERSDSQRIVIGNRDVVLTSLVSSQSYVTPSLARYGIAKYFKAPREALA